MKIDRMNCSEKEIAPSNALTGDEIQLVQETWSRVENSIEMAIDFYNRLFYLYPFLRPMFKENIQLQARKFSAHVSLVIGNIKDRNTLQPMFEEMRNLHLNHNVKTRHYNYVQEALFYALKNHLVKEWDEHTESAWIKFYNIMASQMAASRHNK